MNPATNLVLVGPMGAGKSSIGRRLAERFGLAFFDVDGEVEARCGASVSALFDCEGEAGFRAREREALAALLAGDGLALATGGGAVLDAGNRGLMRARGFVVWLQAGVGEQLRRLAGDRSRPLLERDDREVVLRRLAEERGPLYADAADLVFDTTGLDAAEAAARLAEELDTAWRRQPATTTIPATP